MTRDHWASCSKYWYWRQWQWQPSLRPCSQRGMEPSDWRAIVDHKVVNADASPYINRPARSVLESAATAKKNQHKQACADCQADFTPLVCSTDGATHREGQHFLRRLAARLATKWEVPLASNEAQPLLIWWRRDFPSSPYQLPSNPVVTISTRVGPGSRQEMPYGRVMDFVWTRLSMAIIRATGHCSSIRTEDPTCANHADVLTVWSVFPSNVHINILRGLPCRLESLRLIFTNEPSIFVDGDLDESIKCSASDRLGDLLPQVRARTSPGVFHDMHMALLGLCLELSFNVLSYRTQANPPTLIASVVQEEFSFLLHRQRPGGCSFFLTLPTRSI